MKLVVGLGNPEEEFVNTRHNVGFVVVDALMDVMEGGPFTYRKKFEAEIMEGREFMIVKPQTYMNNSGRSVGALTSFYKLETSQVIIVHDDLDLPLGDYKICLGKGPKVHNGIISCEQYLGSKDFWRVRVGIDARLDRLAISGEDYVLGKFSRLEQETLMETIRTVVLELRRMIE